MTLAVESQNVALQGSAGNRQRLRVGFVMHAMQVAGAEMLVAQTIRCAGDRIDPTIFCLDAVGSLGEQLREEGIEVVCLDRSPGFDIGLVGRLGRELRKRRIEVVHAHQYTPFFYAALARSWRSRSTRVILTEHGRHFPDVVSRKRRLANCLVLSRCADAINACCEFSAGALAMNDGFPQRRIEVIANGIEFDRYGPASDRPAVRAELGLDPQRRFVGMIARFHPVKDHATLLRGFRQVAAQLPDVDLLLVGDGPFRAQLEELVRELDLVDRVKFLGVRHDVPKILQAIDVFTLTSVSEAASLTLMEAMASALPVVVTNVGGNPEIVREGIEGRLVPRGGVGELAAAMIEILSSSELANRMGAAGRARIESHYQLRSTIEKYVELYERLAPRGR